MLCFRGLLMVLFIRMYKGFVSACD